MIVIAILLYISIPCQIFEYEYALLKIHKTKMILLDVTVLMIWSQMYHFYLMLNFFFFGMIGQMTHFELNYAFKILIASDYYKLFKVYKMCGSHKRINH